MSRWPKLSEETIYLMLNDKAYRFGISGFEGWVFTTDPKLAYSFGNEVLMVKFDWNFPQEKEEVG